MFGEELDISKTTMNVRRSSSQVDGGTLGCPFLPHHLPIFFFAARAYCLEGFLQLSSGVHD